jgi:hypothetical protein
MCEASVFGCIVIFSFTIAAAAAAAAFSGKRHYKDTAYQLWHLLATAEEGRWDGLISTWWDVTSGSWIPGNMFVAVTCQGRMRFIAHFCMHYCCWEVLLCHKV